MFKLLRIVDSRRTSDWLEERSGVKQGCEEEEDCIKKKNIASVALTWPPKGKRRPDKSRTTWRRRVERGRAEVHMMTIMRATTASAREQDAQSQKLYPEYESICSCVGTILAHSFQLIKLHGLQ